MWRKKNIRLVWNFNHWLQYFKKYGYRPEVQRSAQTTQLIIITPTDMKKENGQLTCLMETGEHSALVSSGVEAVWNYTPEQCAPSIDSREVKPANGCCRWWTAAGWKCPCYILAIVSFFVQDPTHFNNIHQPTYMCLISARKWKAEFWQHLEVERRRTPVCPHCYPGGDSAPQQTPATYFIYSRIMFAFQNSAARTVRWSVS